MVNSTVNKFWNAASVPPRGGWHFTIQGERIERHSEGEIIDAIRKVRVNNGTFTSDADIERDLWRYYCAQEPKRCEQTSRHSREPAVVDVAPREITKEFEGPKIWAFLNILAVVWEPSLHNYFLQTVAAIVSVLQCPVCREEWRRTLAAFPVDSIQSRYDACRWVWTVHSSVNSRTEKAFYPYARMVTEWGAPMQ